ncbi:MAG: MarR family transcriptional regulator [bacterium]
METKLLSEKYSDRIAGVLNCYDRVVLTGTLQQFCYADGMTAYLKAHHIRIFDYTKFVMPLREKIRDHAEALAKSHDFQIEFIRKKNFRKEQRIKHLLKQHGYKPGLVHIFSAMESCASYKPWYDKRTGKTYLKFDYGKCLHYYFYFIDEELGLCYLRVPTWCPFRLQFYFNGHSLLASQLKRKGIAFELQDNAFVMIADFARANQLAQQLNIVKLHRKLDGFVKRYCPVINSVNGIYHWSTMQAEYATDIIFKQQNDLQAIYPHLLETLIHSVKPENIATFLGQKLHGNYKGEMGNRFDVRILGSRIKHIMGPTSIKMYDKFGLILRVETTVNDVSFFREYREVRHRNGEREMKWAKMRKSIYSLTALQELAHDANRRYLEFISQIETAEVGVKLLNNLTASKVENNHSYKGFNLLAEEDASLLRLLLRGEFAISGLTSLDLRRLLPDKTKGQISRFLKRLRVHGLIKRVGRRYKYYLTKIGRQVAVMALKLRELYVIPTFTHAAV